MKRLVLLIAVGVCICVLFTACQKNIELENSIAPQVIQSENKALALATTSTKLSPQLRAKLAKMPAGYEKRLQVNRFPSLKAFSEYKDMALKATNVIESTPCEENTLVYQWLNDQLVDWDAETYFWAAMSGMLSFPSFHSLLFENGAPDEYFGVNHEYTQKVNKTFRDVKRFWNIQSNDIILDAIHGDMLHDREKLIKMDMILFGDSKDMAEYWADIIVLLIKEVPQYRNGKHPIFTFNAFSQPTLTIPPFGTIPKKIALGDGIMDAYKAIGYDDVAPQAIAAHEFGHQIQFQLNLFGNEISPEATRRTELMADAYAAYYLSHSRGASMQWKRVKQFLQVFFNLGDCGFTEDSHHGTPAQRMAAAEWGYQLANNAQKQGHIMTAQKFTALFEAQLPKLVR